MTAFLAAVRRAAAAIALAAFALPALAALDANAVRKLGADDTDDKLAGIATLAESADPAAFAVLKALADDNLAVLNDGRVVIVAGDSARDAATGAPMPASAGDRESITINNRVRRALADALAVLSLVSPDRAVRLASARSLQKEASPDLLPLIVKAAEQGDRRRDQAAPRRRRGGAAAPGSRRQGAARGGQAPRRERQPATSSSC